MSKRLSDIELALLQEANDDGKVVPVTEFERGLIAGLVVHGYLDSDDRITQLGRGALKGQGGK